MTVQQAIIYGMDCLKKSGAGEYAIDAKLFVMKATDFTDVQIYTKNDYVLNESQENMFRSMIKKRSEGMPTQYILGHCEFMGLDFCVNSSVLIPRNDTETVVEEAIKIINENNLKYAFDMCTGSGAIAVSIAKYCNISVYASDISNNALYIAGKNAFNNGVDIRLFESDMFKSIPISILNNIDIFISNPPYIPTKDIDGLMREVKDYEPIKALDGGTNGTDFYKNIAQNCSSILKKDSYIIVEIGCEQGKEVSNIFDKNGFKNIEIIKDLSGLDRAVKCRNV